MISDFFVCHVTATLISNEQIYQRVRVSLQVTCFPAEWSNEDSFISIVIVVVISRKTTQLNQAISSVAHPVSRAQKDHVTADSKLEFLR